jgi:signal transduction histidine kinase
MRDLPNENTPENAQIIIDEAMRLTTLVNDLLNLSKIQSGAQTLNISEFNLTQLLGQMINRTSELVKKEGYVIQFIYDDEVYVMADETLISQAFYNLLINAINYTGEDKKVVVKQTISRDEVKVEVTDTGEGIAPEDLPYVWDRYYKIDKNHKRAITGTGIGLSIVKSIMEMHGTKYGVVSKVNEGSTFWFCLKRCK